MSVSRDSCGWIAKLRGGVRDSRCRAHLSAWRALRQSALRRVFAATGVVSSTGLESRPGVDCRGPGPTRERTARRECGRARAYSLAIPPTLERAMHDRRTQSVYDAECD